MEPMDFEDILEHAGVKGMEWGVRKDRSEARQTRIENRQLKKADTKLYKQERAKKIESARQLVKSGKLDQDVKSAKEQYRRDKKVMANGRAKAALVAAREARMEATKLALENKDAKEVVSKLALATIGYGYVSDLKKLY